MPLREPGTIWLRRKHRDAWHWIEACSNYPTPRDEVIRATEKPTYGELCSQCLAKERRADFEVEP